MFKYAGYTWFRFRPIVLELELYGNNFSPAILAGRKNFNPGINKKLEEIRPLLAIQVSQSLALPKSGIIIRFCLKFQFNLLYIQNLFFHPTVSVLYESWRYDDNYEIKLLYP